MYLSILALPLLGSTVAGLLGRKIGITGSHIITTSSLLISAALAAVAFYEVGICGSPVTIRFLSWIDSEALNVSWGFLFDSLTVSMLIPVLFVSTLVHLYSVSYMSEDPHNQRFFSYLSLFTFFMLVLVTGENYLIMFIGWEGDIYCLKWFNINKIEYNSLVGIGLSFYNRTFFTDSNQKITSYQRIGPHNIDIISMIVGSTLGDTHLEKRDRGVGTRIIFEQSNKNVEYLMWFHNYLSLRGYCTTLKPKLKKRIHKSGEIYFQYRINSYTFSSFN